jgi:hypothetical protein
MGLIGVRLQETFNAAEQPSSAAAAALSDEKLRQTNIAAAVGCSDWFGQFLQPAVMC